MWGPNAVESCIKMSDFIAYLTFHKLVQYA